MLQQKRHAGNAFAVQRTTRCHICLLPTVTQAPALIEFARAKSLSRPMSVRDASEPTMPYEHLVKGRMHVSRVLSHPACNSISTTELI